MGTKNDPGEYDCYAKAHPEEPMFTLLGRDRTAFHLVRIWSALRWGHFEMARQLLDDAIVDLKILGEKDADEAKLIEALACSDKMLAWFEKGRAIRQAFGNTAPSAANAIQKSESTDTPNAASATA
ncbi:hypothetical protein [Dongia deserti]|uniref:hypothetical protein n=1 Tax=Dongia deserti TaxID=2268030 RepID=UPI000E64644E|nr:hypothetical protein [Dongia deserti]